MHKKYICNRKVNEGTRMYVATNHCPVQWKTEILNNVTSQNNIVITTQAAKELFSFIRDVQNQSTTLFKFVNITF